MTAPAPTLTHPHASPVALSLRGITKRFPLVLANDNISMDVKWGSVHALCGENGAGKSTLMKIVYGAQPPTSGEIVVDGQPVTFSSPADAIAQGIGMVFQHFQLVDTLTVTENVILGAEPTQGTSINYGAARARVAQLIKQFNFDLNPDALVGELPVGLQQKVEILKTLYRGARILILDEPTAVLTPSETEELFEFLKGQYAASGNAVIFISHKLHEVLHISDTISVIRDGRMIGSIPAAGATTETLAKMMVGRDVTLRVNKQPAQPGEVALDVQNVTVRGGSDTGRGGGHGGHAEAVRGVSFQVRAGEIVGIAGVEGNGQSELVEAITGLLPYQGRITYLGREARGVREVEASGLSHVPEDRNERGLVLEMSTAENFILGEQDRAPFAGPLGLLNLDVIEQNARDLSEKYDVRPRSTTLPAGRYSGGNAQKIIVAREMRKGPKILVASQPTRGVDIGAIEFIHARIVEARDQGLAVLLVSADLGEVMNLADRILVMYEGQIAGEVSAAEATETGLGLLMTGSGGRQV
ncbi:ABC transporter ATP-binding protein [Deinococcus wulumuqiensis]|uniref:Sugar ABC transporter ATP-binding protein n=1 Tax=Deinococcus wulumuqiensis TaxID=980427 RepID=A0AAV4K019_9DEIO|nr:ABC transporter ATP-binding protein [Deinococcus wulumuqiensis]QII20586.1 ABC transporter ATP-binding protein [Deinococcus wulumuqiensis R12]GGI72511.1 sugar ABC transporter ATP-binding protein [Deinococcus wulumuqiensis]GGP28537.1 sugar ABC transporter ATP-binding protein [Deinococcus wulumuqiensis]